MGKTKASPKPRAGWRVDHAIRKRVRIAAAQLEISQEKYVERCLLDDLHERGILDDGVEHIDIEVSRS